MKEARGERRGEERKGLQNIPNVSMLVFEFRILSMSSILTLLLSLFLFFPFSCNCPLAICYPSVEFFKLFKSKCSIGKGFFLTVKLREFISP